MDSTSSSPLSSPPPLFLNLPVPSSPLSPLPSSYQQPDESNLGASSNLTLSSLIGPCPVFNPSDPSTHATIDTILRVMFFSPTVESEWQSALAIFLCPLYLIHQEHHIGRVGLQLSTGFDLGRLKIEDGVLFEDTEIQDAVKAWAMEGMGGSTSETSSSFGVRRPDLSTALRLYLENENETYALVSLVLEIKPTPNSEDMARKAVAQCILYLLAAYQCCGCWLGIGFHAGHYVRMVATDSRTIYLETNVAPTAEISVEWLLFGGLDLYPWDLGTPSSPNVDHFRVLWRTVERSIDVLRHVRVDIPLVRLPRPSILNQFDSELFLESHMEHLDLTTDESLMKVAGVVRPSIKRALKARERDTPQRHSGGGPGEGGGSSGAAEQGQGEEEGPDAQGGHGGAGGGSIPRRGFRQGLRSGGAVESGGDVESSPSSARTSQASRSTNSNDTPDTSVSSNSASKQMLSINISEPLGRVEEEQEEQEQEEQEQEEQEQEEQVAQTVQASDGEKVGDESTQQQMEVDEEEGDDVYPEDAVDNKDWDLPTLCRLLRRVRIRLVSTEVMDRLVFTA